MASLKKTIDDVREAVSNSDLDVSEKDLYESLMSEAEGWRMRLEEIEEIEE